MRLAVLRMCKRRRRVFAPPTDDRDRRAVGNKRCGDAAVQECSWNERQLRERSRLQLRLDTPPHYCDGSVESFILPHIPHDTVVLHRRMGVGRLVFLFAILLRVARPGNYVIIVCNGNKRLRLELHCFSNVCGTFSLAV